MGKIHKSWNNLNEILRNYAYFTHKNTYSVDKTQMKIIITGTTGMIGEGILLECLAHPEVTEVLSVSRNPTGKSHPKLKEYIVPDFLNLKEGDLNLQGFDACFFCAGISAVGKTEVDYRKVTYDTTLHFAKILQPKADMCFMYVSGGGTDHTEQSRMMWARVKGKTENDLAQLPFKQSFGFRIGFVKATPGQMHVLPYYRYIAWLFPVFKALFPGVYNTMHQVANAMVYLTTHRYNSRIIYVKDIHHINKMI